MTRTKARTRARGISLIHMMIFSILLGSVLVVAEQIFARSMALSRRAAAAQETIDSFDNMISTLRKDAWGASSMQVAGDGSLVVTVPGKQTVVWAVLEGVTRMQKGQPSRTWEKSPSVRFAVAGPILTVTSEDAGKVTLALPSQVMLLEGKR